MRLPVRFGKGGGRSAALLAIAAALAGACATPAEAQGRGGGGVLTLQQVQQRFFGMSVVHINKCDRNGDGLFDRGERACVQGLYDVLYRQR